MTSKKRLLLSCLGLAAICVLAYLPGLTSPFTKYDDSLYVTGNIERLNQSLAKQWDASRAWNGEFVEFFPLRDTVYWVVHALFETNPLPYHLANLFFHITATLLMLQLLLRLGLEEKAALFATLLFAVHPVHIESVVWIAGLKDPMYTAFMLLGLSAYASYRQQPTVGKYALMLAGLILGLLVKSLAIVMPVLMLGMELLLPPRARWRLIVARLAGPTIITAQFLAIFLAIGQANNAISGLHGGSRMSHTVLMLWAQAKYLKQALLPTSFRLIYCFEPPTGWLDWRLWGGALVITAGVAVAIAWRKHPLRLFFLGWYAVAMLPTSNLVPFPAIMADRYLYAATVGTCALIGMFATRLPRRAFLIVTVAAAVLLTGATAARSWVWQDEEQLWLEPDLDPACVLDTSFPAAQSHVLRYWTTTDRYEGMMALERALMSPGLQRTGESMLCDALIAAAGEAVNLGEPERAVSWAKTANRYCPNVARGWNISMIINLHKNPEVAARAAMKAYRLLKTPETELFVWLTLMELNGDPRAPAEISRLAHLGLPEVCEKIVVWALDVPRFGPALAEPVEFCAKTITAKPPETTPAPAPPP